MLRPVHGAFGQRYPHWGRCRRNSQFTKPRLLLRGEGSAYLSQSGAFALADGIALVGTDASSIAPYEDAVFPHQGLLLAGVPIGGLGSERGAGWKLHSGRVSTELEGWRRLRAGRVLLESKRCFNGVFV